MTTPGGEQSRYEEAFTVSLSNADHFEREGFSGDMLVAPSAQMGFTALQVNVHGEHPLKEILKGNTRSYFVVDGEGTFILNGETTLVSKGDLVVIPANSQYEYQGVMTLFEFNVSPGNSFRDKKIEPAKEYPERNPEDHHSANAQRQAAAYALAEILKRGYTLTNPDIKGILPHYGYSPNSPVHSSVGMPGFRRFIAERGVELEVQKYRNREVYFDGTLPPEETDIVTTQAKIDDSIRRRT